jgi:hypothetical protein
MGNHYQVKRLFIALTKMTALRTAGRLFSVGMLATSLFAGCASARGSRQILSSAELLERGEANQVPEFFRKGEHQIPEGVVIAKVSAEGNVYAQPQHLEARLLAEGAAIGADFVVATHQEVLRDKVVHHRPSGLIGIALRVAQGTGDMSVISRPVLHGVACRRAKASLGAELDADGLVQYVRRGSAAERAGLKEGMRLLAINEAFMRADEFVLDREVFSRNPGDVVEVDAIAADGEKLRLSVELGEPAPPIRTPGKLAATPSPPPTPPTGS